MGNRVSLDSRLPAPVTESLRPLCRDYIRRRGCNRTGCSFRHKLTQLEDIHLQVGFREVPRLIQAVRYGSPWDIHQMWESIKLLAKQATTAKVWQGECPGGKTCTFHQRGICYRWHWHIQEGHLPWKR